jgi:Spy/CpxP family protein refolding chaperone
MENTKTRREAAVLVVVVFLLGALLGGVATHVWTIHAASQQGAPHGRDQVLSQMTRALDFTPQQLQVVTGIVDDTHTQIRALYGPLDGQREQIRQQARTRIRAVLTPEQQPKFDDFLRRLDEQRKKEEGR